MLDMPTWVTTLPVEWTSNTDNTRAITGNCDVAVQYQGGSSFRCRITYTSYGDKLKEIEGTCNTYGPYGSDSKDFSNSLLNADNIIVASVGFAFSSSISKPVTQHFQVEGTVTGKNGTGTFSGKKSIEVNPARLISDMQEIK